MKKLKTQFENSRIKFKGAAIHLLYLSTLRLNFGYHVSREAAWV